MADSTAKLANNSKNVKQSKPASDNSYMITLADITKKSIDQYFPLLKTAPDILYVAMAIWGMESGWKLLHRKSSGVIDSSHLSPVDPRRSTLVGKGYNNSNPIQNILNSTDYVAKTNVIQGYVAHGLSACMGCYHVKGTPNYITDFAPNQAIVDALGLAVDPGQSITALFAANDELAMTRSVVAGLIILQNKYKIYLNSKNLATYHNPAQAIFSAVGAYVGKAGSRDINGYSPEMRQKDVMGSPSSRLSALAAIDIKRTGKAGTDWDPTMAALAATNAPGSINSKSNYVSNSAPGTQAKTNVNPKQPIGCTA